MNIETYVGKIVGFYMVLFLFTILLGIVEICNRIRKNKVIWAGFFPCSLLYSFIGIFSTLSAYMAYNDITEPGYGSYKGLGITGFYFTGCQKLSNMAVHRGIALFIIEMEHVKEEKETETNQESDGKDHR